MTDFGKAFFERIEKGEANIEGIPIKRFLGRGGGNGSSIVLDTNVRLHHILEEPSLQVHRLRSEEYILLEGRLIIYRGDYFDDKEKTVGGLRETLMIPGDRVIIPNGTVPIPLNLSPSATFIEISHGCYEESDNERIYDVNGRNPELSKYWEKKGYKQGLSIKDLIQQVRNRTGDRTS
jgi:mannose-6-phosphate isomerase-like protein (cupin superfamily)